MPASTSSPAIGFAGLGSMGAGMSTQLLSQGHALRVFDPYGPSLKKVASFSPLATPCSTPKELVLGCDFVCLMVVNQAQVEDFFLGAGEAASAMKDGAVIIVFSTVEPGFMLEFGQKIDALRKGISVVDSPVSGGAKRAADGTLSVMASSTPSAIEAALPILKAVTQAPIGKLYTFGTGCGDGSRYKMVHQLLAATHCVGVCEGLAFAASLGLSTKQTRAVIKKSSGWSWMLDNRGGRVIDPSGGVESALTIMLKDAGIIATTSRATPFAAPLASIAEQMLIAGKGAGFGSLDDSSVAKIYEFFGGKSAVSPEGEEVSDELVIKEDGEGASGKIWLVNQLLTAINIAAAAEAVAFATALGMDGAKVVEIVLAAAGTSTAFASVTLNILKGSHSAASPDTTVDAFTASLTKVLNEARKISLPLFLGSSVHQTFLMSKAAGWGKEDGSAIVKYWETLMNISTAERQ